ncbi:probable prefoldin subunit 2 [Bombus vosnesenskii]|uniref:Probable prefoldin subunit 2 n=3 Tax=Pyrobombus TaxID=144703 RepID=A0A6J3KYH4_9HYME|nr:probable prefoldin subunit 2 [Bombus impatiens]XP_033192421.1 probable prefoldin subunit 2 [Bombus vancouverensis nearcticus]XP_033309333.1 probable prefoldin subunit 2 [Bombus bifarius]XP_033358180.1 probable prefoldin subunit 2 [Bombus vosnesenskii]XP_043601957.1 probable prefoldin subunit 2 [Bombus pyrosoma]XP_060818009.1 probable prefoldin subunit 2 [Bombus pascuorum]
MASDKKSGKSSKGTKSTTEILSEFQMLRNEQRAMANKLSEMEMELNEHKIVIDTLKNIDPKRKCYRMTGGVLCERTVEDVMPALVTNKEQLIKVIDALNDQLTKKGLEINEFKEKHNIRIRGQQDMQQRQGEDKDSKEAKRSAVVVNSLLSNYS